MAFLRQRVATVVFVCTAISVWAAQAETVCGGPDTPNCGPKPATFVGPASSCKMYPDSFWDPRNGGECWTCPKDFIRSLKPVTDAAACMQPLNGIGYAAATFQQKAGCPDGSFLDLRNGGECWSCPDGSTRTAAKVTDWNACLAQEDYKTATKYALATGPLKTDCPAGQFWDPNGYCWSCPADYKRSVYAVTSTKACFKTGQVNLYATFISARCPNGFWDPRNGGECWSCPTGYIRDAFAVTDPKACITTAAKVTTATLQGKWACDKGNIWDPKLVPNGDGALVASCWDCPDQTKRSVFPVDGPKACSSPSFMWHTPDYVEPGLFNLIAPTTAQPVVNLLIDVFNDPEAVKGLTAFLYAYRASKGATGGVLDAAVAEEWMLIAKNPGASDALKAYLFNYLTTLATNPTGISQNEANFLAAWEKYQRDRRIYIAQDARNSYEAWKIADAWAQQHQTDIDATYNLTNMQSLFDYGRVPPQFAEIAENALKNGYIRATTTAAAVSTLGTISMVVKPMKMFLLPFRRAPLGFAGAGPQIIVMIAVMLGQMAIEQVKDIATMDARLTSTMELASRPFSLAAKLATAGGQSEMMAAWAMAVAPATAMPPNLASPAAKALLLAQQSGYWASELR